MHQHLNWFAGSYRTTVGKKAAMALSGLFLFGWVFAHMAGNLKVLQGPEKFNAYADWLRGMGSPLLPHNGALWLVRGLLVLAVATHVIAALQLTRLNRAARPEHYKALSPVQAGYAQRTMVFSGLLIALYVVYHILHLTLGSVHGDFLPHDPYHNVVSGFRLWPVAGVYMAANLLLGIHLYHGLWSFFQSLGWNHPRYNHWRRAFAVTASIVLTAGFLSVPLSVLAGVVS